MRICILSLSLLHAQMVYMEMKNCKKIGSYVLFWCSARRGRIYLPQDELAQAGLSEDDIFAGKVTDKWRTFMKKQIQRARKFFDDAENGVKELSSASRWPVSSF